MKWIPRHAVPLMISLAFAGSAIAAFSPLLQAKEKFVDRLVKTPPTHHEALCSSEEDCNLSFVAKLKNAPFPYSGPDGDDDRNFFDGFDSMTGHRYHTTGNGTRYTESEHYSDNQVFFHIPAQFDPHSDFSYVVYFHGHMSEIASEVAEDKILDQVDQANKNVILIAPQFAKNARDSSAGKFYHSGGFKNFMREAEEVLENRWPKASERPCSFHSAPIVLLGYSGGYKPIAYVLDRGGVNERLDGVLLVDALYGELEKFENWFRQNHRDRFFVSLYTSSTQQYNLKLSQDLQEENLPLKREIPGKIQRGLAYFGHSPAEHQDVIQVGPPADPIELMLKGVYHEP